ncbi:MAG TPA: tyrosine--tRNA ligase, partial [Bacteroidetes bacterium]|nr:tyrosine--tRNA ligase [Bacteroidota bacterium]
AVTTPLLTKSDGKKFGKSEEGNIWLDPKKTSPYKFYQFFINVDDAMVPNLMRYFSLKSKEEIEAIEEEYKENPREYKKILAEEMTKNIHSAEAFESVMNVSEILFNKKASADKLKSLSVEEFETIAMEIPSFKISKDVFGEKVDIIDLIAELTSIVSSKSDARRAIKGNALSINKEKVTDFDYKVKSDDLIHDRFLMVENGKKNKFIVEVK